MHDPDPTYPTVLVLSRIVKGDNPRRFFDPKKHAELVASITRRGVLQPILLRPKPGTEDIYALVAGERRYRAALAPQAVAIDGFDMVVTCVDSASARRAVGAAIDRARKPPAYWVDLGNRATDGQFVIGCPSSAGREDDRLPTVLELFPELADESLADDDAPSCSVAEALERQSLFVNRVVASHALGLLFDLLGRGSIGHAGAFLNLTSGQAMPIALARGGPNAAAGLPVTSDDLKTPVAEQHEDM